MSDQLYYPQAGSLARRVCDWFLANPDEEMGTDDIALKFEHALNVPTLLRPAVDAKLLTMRKSPRSMSNMYLAGPELRAGAAQAAAREVTGQQRRYPQKRATAARVALPDPTAVLIEADVPLPPPTRPSVQPWHDLFARMQLNESFGVDLPASKRVINLARDWGKPLDIKFAMRQVDASTARIWRTQ